MNVWLRAAQTALQRNSGFRSHSSVATAQSAGRKISLIKVLVFHIWVPTSHGQECGRLHINFLKDAFCTHPHSVFYQMQLLFWLWPSVLLYSSRDLKGKRSFHKPYFLLNFLLQVDQIKLVSGQSIYLVLLLNLF